MCVYVHISIKQNKTNQPSKQAGPCVPWSLCGAQLCGLLLVSSDFPGTIHSPHLHVGYFSLCQSPSGLWLLSRTQVALDCYQLAAPSEAHHKKLPITTLTPVELTFWNTVGDSPLYMGSTLISTVGLGHCLVHHSNSIVSLETEYLQTENARLIRWYKVPRAWNKDIHIYRKNQRTFAF